MTLRGLLRPFSALLGASVLTQFILLLISPLLTRLYTPEDFGYYGVIIASCASMAALSGGRLELAIPITRRRRDVAVLFLMTILVAIPVTVLLSSMAALMINNHLEYDKIYGLHGLSAWLQVATLAIVMFQALNYWLLWHKNYKAVARARWMQGISLGVVQLASGVFTLGVWGLVVGHTIGQALGTLVGLQGCWKVITRDLRKLTVRKCIAIIRWHRDYPLIMAPATLINLMGQHLPVILVGLMFGAKEAGFYAIARRVCGAPLSLIGQAISQVYVAEAPRLITEAPQTMVAVFSKLVSRMLLSGSVIVLLIVLFAPEATVVVFGVEWLGAGVLMQILAVVFVLDFVAMPFSLTLTFIRHYRKQLWWDITRVLGVLLAFAIGEIFDLNFYETMVILSLALSASYFYLLFIMWRGLTKWAHEQPAPMKLDIVPLRRNPNS